MGRIVRVYSDGYILLGIGGEKNEFSKPCSPSQGSGLDVVKLRRREKVSSEGVSDIMPALKLTSGIDSGHVSGTAPNSVTISESLI